MGKIDEIIQKESVVKELSDELNKIKCPNRTITYQVQNMKYGNRNTSKDTAIKIHRRRVLSRNILLINKYIERLKNE